MGGMSRWLQFLKVFGGPAIHRSQWKLLRLPRHRILPLPTLWFVMLCIKPLWILKKPSSDHIPHKSPTRPFKQMLQGNPQPWNWRKPVSFHRCRWWRSPMIVFESCCVCPWNWCEKICVTICIVQLKINPRKIISPFVRIQWNLHVPCRHMMDVLFKDCYPTLSQEAAGDAIQMSSHCE